MTQPGGAPPPTPPGHPLPPKPALGRAGCLPGFLAASPFLLAALACFVVAVIAFATPSPKPPHNPNVGTTVQPGTTRRPTTTLDTSDDGSDDTTDQGDNGSDGTTTTSRSSARRSTTTTTEASP